MGDFVFSDVLRRGERSEPVRKVERSVTRPRCRRGAPPATLPARSLAVARRQAAGDSAASLLHIKLKCATIIKNTRKAKTMIIEKNFKNSKLAIGSNYLSEEGLKALGITAIAAALFAIALGGRSKNGKKKKPFWLLLLPAVFKSAKAAIMNKKITDLADDIAENGYDYDIEVVDAIPIENEEEVYEHI